MGSCSFRNSEKRKEKSRDAARCRRGKESEVFTELAQQLPITETMAAQLDKASVMRLALSHLQISQIMMKRRNDEEEVEDSGLDYLTFKALDGFIFMLSKEGDLIYVSESVAKYLGIQQIDMMGQSIYEFTHPCDHDEIKDVLSSKSGHKENQIFFIRMKCTITSKGRSVNLKSASYKVIKCSGRMLDPYDINGEDVKNSKESRPFLAAVGEPIPHPSNIEVLLDSKTFLSRHNMDMKFTFCDERMKELIGYDSEELLGKSLYNYHHVLDSEVVDKAYKDLFSKGQTMTGQYRFMAKRGGFVWVITQGTVIYNSRTQKPQCVVCVHFVLSDYEEKAIVLSDVQQSEEVVELEELASPILCTEDVFQPRPGDMDEEDYYFPPGAKKVEQKTQLVDLTHLAPNAGDACVPLSFPLTAGDKSLEFGRFVEQDQQLDNNLPVIQIKEEPGIKPTFCNKRRTPYADYNSSPTSPKSQETSPMSSPGEYLTTFNAADISAMDKFFSALDTTSTDFDQSESQTQLEELEFDKRAPYIPMTEEHDFNLLPLSAEELFTLNSDFDPGLFGTTESVFIPKEQVLESPPQPTRLRLREMLEGSTAKVSLERPPDRFNIKQMKRPFDKSSMEKGPPAKERKIETGPARTEKQKPSSVLMNLLLRGEDTSAGYSVNAIRDLTAKQQQRVRLPQKQTSTYLTEMQTGTIQLENDIFKAFESELNSLQNY